MKKGLMLVILFTLFGLSGFSQERNVYIAQTFDSNNVTMVLDYDNDIITLVIGKQVTNFPVSCYEEVNGNEKLVLIRSVIVITDKYITVYASDGNRLAKYVILKSYIYRSYLN